MEFKFNVNDIFKEPIVEINNNLIPPGFSGDRRALWDTVGKVSEVVNSMGAASAAAQNLTKPITTAERLRNSEHRLYFLIDQSAHNGKGAVTGMLKTGTKGLYIFDRDGQHYQVSPSCILDFYVHESRQRNGLGKQLFEHMLKKEEIQPVKMAIDRPSEKLLGFLNKHYQLNTPVKQMNNYVVFDDFFPKSPEKSNVIEPDTSGGTAGKKESANGLQSFSSPYGRYGAPRPPCSMGQIIHNQTSTINNSQEATGVQSMPATNYQGMQNTCPNPNSNVTQSAPNINYGEQIQNQNELTNSGQYQGQINQANLNMMNSGRINEIQNQTSATNNYQEYQNAQPTPTNQYVNQYPIPPQTAQVYYNSVPNIPNQYHATPDGLVQSVPTIMEQPGAQPTNIPDPAYQQQNYNSQENPYQNMPAETNYWPDPKSVYSQPNNSANYMLTQQQQLQQNQMIPQQNYANLNQQFENININNQIQNQEMANANYPQQAEYPPLNYQPSNMKVLSETQSMYQDPKSVFTTQAGTPLAYVPQGNSAGDFVTSNVHSGVESDQSPWNQQNLLKASQYQPHSLTQPNLNVMQAPQYTNNFVPASQPGFPQSSAPAEAGRMVAPQSVQDMGMQVPHVHANQQQQAQNNTNKQYYQTNQGLIEPLQSSQSSQQFNKSIEQHNIRKYASDSVVPAGVNPSYAQHNQNQAYGGRNFANQIAPQPMQHQTFNHPNQNMPSNQFIHGNESSKQVMSSHGMPLQSYNPQNPNVANSQFVQYQNQQNTSPPQTTYSAGYLPPGGVQEARQNVPNDSYSVPNVSQRNNQNNMSIMNNPHAHGKNVKNSEINGIVQTKGKRHNVGDQNGKRQPRTLDDEVNLSYGYPPQCATPQPITKSNPISIRQPF